MMSFTGAIVAGLVATFITYVTTRLTTMNLMGFERYLACLFTERYNRALGFLLLFVGGVVIGVIYAALWSVNIGWPDYLYGLIFGIVQWLVLGFAAGALPAVPSGDQMGILPAPGIYMTKLLGPMAFIAGLVNHTLFGCAFAFFYQFFRSRYA